MLTSYSFQNIKRDLMKVFGTIVAASPTFLSKIPIIGSAHAYVHEWPNDVIKPTHDTVAADIDAEDTTIAVSDGSKFSRGMVLCFDGCDEQMLVESIAGDVVTVERGYGETTPCDIADESIVRILYRPEAEGSPAGDDNWSEPTTERNYTQIFTRTVRVSNTARNSQHELFDDILDRAVRDGLMQLQMELNAAAIFGRRYANAADSSVPRTAGGVIYFVDNELGNVHDAEGADLTPEMMNDLLETIVKKGGAPNMILCGTKLARAMSSFNVASGSTPIVRTRPQDLQAGSAVYEFVGDLPLGLIETIVVDVSFPSDKLMFLDSRKLALVPLAGRGFSDFDATPAGADFTARRILGEYTFEVRNPLEAHGIIKNIGTT